MVENLNIGLLSYLKVLFFHEYRELIFFNLIFFKVRLRFILSLDIYIRCKHILFVIAVYEELKVILLKMKSVSAEAENRLAGQLKN